MDGADTLTSGTSDILTGTIKLQNGAEALTDGFLMEFQKLNPDLILLNLV